MRHFFGMFATLAVAGTITLAWVVFTPGSQALLAVAAGFAICIGVQGMRDGVK